MNGPIMSCVPLAQQQLLKLKQTKHLTDGLPISGRADVSQNGMKYTCMLTAVSGYKKEMSFVVNVNAQEYVEDVKVFFESLDLHEPSGSGQLWNGNDTPPEKGATMKGNYVYVVPAGMDGKKIPGWNCTQLSRVQYW